MFLPGASNWTAFTSANSSIDSSKSWNCLAVLQREFRRSFSMNSRFLCMSIIWSPYAEKYNSVLESYVKKMSDNHASINEPKSLMKIDILSHVVYLLILNYYYPTQIPCKPNDSNVLQCAQGVLSKAMNIL